VQESQEPIIDALPLGTSVPMTGEDLAESDWLRLEVRGLIREFLSVVPRSQPSMALVFPRPDGTPGTITRAELSAAIDRMRPRQRQIIRLAVEERRSQEEVCALLNGISLRTLQRDQAEALDLLTQL
jgi:DNA-directed RNA polymerase specialized sigma24 family protein